MNKRIILICGIVLLIFFTAGTVYSAFNNNGNVIINQSIAKFIFEAESSEEIGLSLTNIFPGDVKDYNFSVRNGDGNSTSHVTIDYQMTIKTYNYMPLNINLYKVNDGNEELFMTCNEANGSRNEKNELVCNTETTRLSYSDEAQDDYILRLSFPSEYNGLEYSDLVDFLNVEVNSWQATKGGVK